MYTYGIHPWSITTTSDELIFYFGQSEIHSQVATQCCRAREHNLVFSYHIIIIAISVLVVSGR